MDDDMMNDILTVNIGSREALDSCFSHMPQVITHIIWDYMRPYCKVCEKCCVYCMFECAQDNGCVKASYTHLCAQLLQNNMWRRIYPQAGEAGAVY